MAIDNTLHAAPEAFDRFSMSTSLSFFSLEEINHQAFMFSWTILHENLVFRPHMLTPYAPLHIRRVILQYTLS